MGLRWKGGRNFRPRPGVKSAGPGSQIPYAAQGDHPIRKQTLGGLIATGALATAGAIGAVVAAQGPTPTAPPPFLTGPIATPVPEFTRPPEAKISPYPSPYPVSTRPYIEATAQHTPASAAVPTPVAEKTPTPAGSPAGRLARLARQVDRSGWIRVSDPSSPLSVLVPPSYFGWFRTYNQLEGGGQVFELQVANLDLRSLPLSKEAQSSRKGVVGVLIQLYPNRPTPPGPPVPADPGAIYVTYEFCDGAGGQVAWSNSQYMTVVGNNSVLWTGNAVYPNSNLSYLPQEITSVFQWNETIQNWNFWYRGYPANFNTLPSGLQTGVRYLFYSTTANVMLAQANSTLFQVPPPNPWAGFYTVVGYKDVLWTGSSTYGPQAIVARLPSR